MKKFKHIIRSEFQDEFMKNTKNNYNYDIF